MRVKGGVTSHQRHKKVWQQTKGMGHMRRASYRLGKQAVIKALQYAYRDRRNKKRDFRRLRITRISDAAKLNGTSYSKLMAGLKASGNTLDRKVLSEIAVSEPEAFKAIVASVQTQK